MGPALPSIVTLLYGAAVPGLAPAPAPSAQHAHASTGDDALELCPVCPVGRDATGTSWQPDLTSGPHHGWQALGSWQAAFHVDATLAYTDEGGPRGDEKTFSPNYAMLNVRRPLGGGGFGVRTMFSLEPAMGPEGYPLLLQTGETADGVTALVDRQHPHDFVMELAATYSRAIGGDRAYYVYAAAVGAPAIGPPPFMHRASGSTLPVAPITHHWFDSTHLTYGVITGGFVASPKTKFEASVFRGREPDQHRWGLEAPGLDSFAVRVSVNPTRSLALQVSAANLEDAEPLHPGADISRLTASAMYSTQWRGTTLDSTLAWGRNSRTPSIVTVPGGSYVSPSSVAQALLAEATLQRGAHAVVARAERAQKDELFPLDDPRHSTLFPVSRVTAGYAFTLARTRHVSAQVGAAAAWSFVDSAIEPDYGGDPAAGLVFLRLALH